MARPEGLAISIAVFNHLRFLTDADGVGGIVPPWRAGASVAIHDGSHRTQFVGFRVVTWPFQLRSFLYFHKNSRFSTENPLAALDKDLSPAPGLEKIIPTRT